MRLLICGDREWTDLQLIRKAVKSLLPYLTEIIEGEARGADSLGKKVAEDLNIPVLKFPADWAKYGKSAGPIRNQQMLDEGKPDIVFAFHNDIEHSKGTKDMVTRARKANIKTVVFTR
jgi:hypothetical protein